MTGSPSTSAVEQRRLTSRQLASEIAAAAGDAIAERGEFVVVLAGGTSPVGVYRWLREADTDFSRWCVVPSDERCLPAGHPDRNDTMLRAALVDHVPIGRFVAFEAERGGAEAARRAAGILDELPTFDLALLGIGGDGHTASLFDAAAAADPASAVAVDDAPKPPAERVSIGAARLSDSRLAQFVTGPDKPWAIRQLLAGGPIPACAITAARRELVVLDG